MADPNPRMVAPVSVGTRDFARAVAVCDRVLPTLGSKRIMEHPDEPYYGCFVRDPDGHKIEAAYWDMELVHKLYIDKRQA